MFIDNKRYICTVGDTDWVQNARINPHATLQRGRKIEKIRLVELPENKRAVILRQFPLKVPGGVRFFTMILGISGTPESFEQAADKCRVFRID